MTQSHSETLQEHLLVTVEIKYNANVDEQCIAINYYKRKSFWRGGHKTSREPYCGVINLSLWFLKQSKFQQWRSISKKANEKQIKKIVNFDKWFVSKLCLKVLLLLTLSWRRPLSYRNQSIDWLCKAVMKGLISFIGSAN